jgi:hypothetical protein
MKIVDTFPLMTPYTAPSLPSPLQTLQPQSKPFPTAIVIGAAGALAAIGVTIGFFYHKDIHSKSIKVELLLPLSSQPAHDLSMTL